MARAPAARLRARSHSRTAWPEGQPTESLTDVSRGHSAVVIFWSADCGPALEAIPDIDRVTRRPGASGTAVLVVRHLRHGVALR